MKRTAAMGFLLIIFLTVGGLTIISFEGVVREDSLIIDNRQDGSTVSYTPHDWISIIGNDDFHSQAALEGWPGLGTEEDPIIIEGYSFRESRHLFRAIECDVFFEFRNNFLDGVDQAWCGFYMSNAANAKIHNNTIVNAAVPFHVINLNNCLFEDNHLYNNGNMAFAFELICVGNVIKENVMHDNFAGIWLDWNCTDNLIIENDIYDNTCDGIVILEDARDNIVTNNLIHGNSQSGIYCRGINNTFTDNQIFGNTHYGFLLAYGGNIIHENVIQENGRCGIRAYGFYSNNHRNQITNNSILENGDYGIKLGTGCDNNTVQWNNIIGNGDSQQATDYGGSNDFRYNYWLPGNNTDDNGDSFGDIPYLLDGPSNTTDEYPLMNYTLQLPSDYEYVPPPEPEPEPEITPTETVTEPTETTVTETTDTTVTETTETTLTETTETTLTETTETTVTETTETSEMNSPEFPLLVLATMAGVSCMVIIITGMIWKNRKAI